MTTNKIKGKYKHQQKEGKTFMDRNTKTNMEMENTNTLRKLRTQKRHGNTKTKKEKWI